MLILHHHQLLRNQKQMTIQFHNLMNESIQAKNKHKIMIEFGFDYFGIFI